MLNLTLQMSYLGLEVNYFEFMTLSNDILLIFTSTNLAYLQLLLYAIFLIPVKLRDCLLVFHVEFLSFGLPSYISQPT